ncbi:MAG: PhoH family protein [Bdellovibrionales bacterium]|nr:PhoH family protein [Bdellovibrionales bacterium]
MSIELELDQIDLCKNLFGENDNHLALIEKHFGIEIFARGTHLRIEGDQKIGLQARSFLLQLYEILKKGITIKTKDIQAALRILEENPNVDLKEFFLSPVPISNKNLHITPKTHLQKKYVELINEKDIVFGYGPAGTGKTYLAMAMAIAHFMERRVKRIILTRPAVEAGEKLGFLPGDLTEKVNPYLRPLYDALYDMMDVEKAHRLIETETIEVAPLAFMRGRTLSDAFIILDEAQNTTQEQMKMFLTRLGDRSKMVVNGDITQIDLPRHQQSGLREALHILRNVKDVGFVQFTQNDVVRHHLVQKVIDAYEKATP